MQQMSQGARRDMLVIQYAHAMAVVSKIETQGGVISLPNTIELPEIREQIEDMELRLSSTFQNGTSYEDKVWFRSKLKKLDRLLHMMDKRNVGIERFMLNLLYVNFSDNRSHRMDDIFIDYQDPEQYFTVLDLINDCTGQEDGEMYDLAIEAVKFIKG